MVDVVYRRGVFLPGADLWLDPGGSVSRAFVSHAHSDHTGRHGRTIATPVTLRLMEARMGALEGELEALPFGEVREFDRFSMRLLPAGHVLGSAQSYIETEGGSVLYTGDFKLRKGATAEEVAGCQAGTLIMETTYGLPKYVFPPADEVIAEIVKFCVEALEEGSVPVLLGYSLGKAQEILASLEGVGLKAMVHGSIARLLGIYAEEGIRFPEIYPWDPAKAGGHVVVCPPGVAGSRAVLAIRGRRVAAVTGWAMDASTVHRMRCDVAFPLSDHAGFDDLLRHVEAVQPGRVLTLHGFAAEFARELRARGVEAWALTGPNQLDLALPGSVVPVGERKPVECEEFEGGLMAIVKACDAAGKVTGRIAKRGILAAYLRTLDDGAFVLAVRWLCGRVYPASESAAHGAGWAVIKRALVAASGMDEGEFRAISRRFNDSGTTAEEVMRGVGGTANPDLPDVDAFLRDLRTACGPHAKTALLAERLKTLPPGGAKFLVKILTGNMRIGVKESLIEEAVAEALDVDAGEIRAANMLLGDPGEVAVAARAGRLDAVGLRVFRPVKCMLASPAASASEICKKLAGRVWVEEKIDGIRAQIHSSGGRVEIFSRDLHNVTAVFPELAAAALLVDGDFVADGEIVAWAGGRPGSFFDLQRRLGRIGGDLFLGGEVPVRFMAFDLLFVTGRTVFREPLAVRRCLLEGLGFSAPLVVAPGREVESAEAVDEAFDQARAGGYEGLVAKDPQSPYTPGRRGGAWMKLKKRFATLDVVVTAVEYGHGRRRDVLSDYTFAVRDSSTNRLVTIGKAYSGLTDAEIAELTALFLSIATSRTGNRLEVEPRVVLEIAFDSIRVSARHESGLALRFPRIERIRRDKTADEIDTLGSARRLVAVAG